MSLQSRGLAIQEEYADKRRRAMNKRDEEKITGVKATIERLAKRDHVTLDKLATKDSEGWLVAYRRITDALQNADLTINLAADSWFSKGNTYETYATTYQKNITPVGDKKVLKTQYVKDEAQPGKDKSSEDADVRLVADEKVTLPDKWKTANILHPQRRRIYKAMSTTGGKQLGDLKQADVGDGKVGFEIDNRHFNPHAKQVFAALNYGRRVNGASVNYGYSFITLKPALKRKAIYFPGDTFAVCIAPNAVNQQCTLETLGAVLAYCQYDMANAIWDGCFYKATCPETAEASLLLEAHIFQEVKVARDVQSLSLSRQIKGGALAQDVWDVVKNNARTWCYDNHVQLIMLSA